MITTVLCYSATSGSSVADCGKPCRVDMGNVGLNALVDRALSIGYLRLFSKREELNLRFDGLNYSTWLDRVTFTPDMAKLIDAVKNQSQRHDLSSRVLQEGVKELHEAMLDPREVCNGTDLVEILSIGLRSMLGNNDAKKVASEVLMSSLRLAFSEQDFRSSILNRDLEEWQHNSPGFQVIKSELTCGKC